MYVEGPVHVWVYVANIFFFLSMYVTTGKMSTYEHSLIIGKEQQRLWVKVTQSLKRNLREFALFMNDLHKLPTVHAVASYIQISFLWHLKHSFVLLVFYLGFVFSRSFQAVPVWTFGFLALQAQSEFNNKASCHN